MESRKFNKQFIDIMCYLSRIGFLFAFIFGDRKESAAHLNNGLVCIVLDGIANSIMMIQSMRIIYYAVRSLYFAFCLCGCYYAIIKVDKYLPISSHMRIFK